MWRLLASLAVLPIPSSSLVGENAIVERPQVECSEETISFSIRTLHPFRGSIYIKGQHDSEVCRHVFYTNDVNVATFTVRIGDCGMIRMRQPFGTSYSAVFVATFHPQLVTKVDRAYNVRCTYEHASKVVESNLDIGPLITENIEQDMTILPNCQYSIREGSVEGPVARSTAIGKTLVHVWECANPKFGMLVRNCYVTDGDREQIKVIDERGCPLRGEIPSIGQLVYDATLSKAYVAIDVFTFADRSRQLFRCEIQVCSLPDNGCLGVTPPNCPLVPRGGFRPNSIVDPSVNPTQVLATFQGQLRSNSIGNTIIDGTLTPGTVPHHPLVLPTSSAENFAQQPWRREQNTIQEEGEAPMENNSTRIQDSSDEFAMPQDMGELYLRDHPLDIFVKSTTPASAVKHAGEQRHRRLRDVIDVESEYLSIQPFDDPVSEAMSAEKADAMVDEQKVTCLNRPALIIVVTALAATTLTTMLSITYFFTDLFKRSKSIDALQQNFPPMSPHSSRSNVTCLSEESQTPIIFTRRLGQTNYGIPIGFA